MLYSATPHTPTVLVRPPVTLGTTIPILAPDVRVSQAQLARVALLTLAPALFGVDNGLPLIRPTVLIDPHLFKSARVSFCLQRVTPLNVNLRNNQAGVDESHPPLSVFVDRHASTSSIAWGPIDANILICNIDLLILVAPDTS